MIKFLVNEKVNIPDILFMLFGFLFFPIHATKKIKGL